MWVPVAGEGIFLDMGTPTDYEAVCQRVLADVLISTKFRLCKMRSEPGILRYIDFFHQGTAGYGGYFLRAFSLCDRQPLIVFQVAEQRP